jgi:hypothetical protein
VHTAIIGVLVHAAVAFGVTQLGGDKNKPSTSGARVAPTPTTDSGSAATPTATAAPPTKDKALVMVFNGTAKAGLAAQFKGLLVDDGYTQGNVAIGNVPEAQQVLASVVMYKRGDKSVAQAVATTLGIDAPVKLLDATTQQLIAGLPADQKKDYDAVVIVGQDKSQ